MCWPNLFIHLAAFNSNGKCPPYPRFNVVLIFCESRACSLLTSDLSVPFLFSSFNGGRPAGSRRHMYVYVRVCMYIYMCPSIYIYTYAQTHIYIYVYIYVYIFVDIFIKIYLNLPTHSPVSLSIYKCVCVHTCVCRLLTSDFSVSFSLQFFQWRTSRWVSASRPSRRQVRPQTPLL